MREKIIIRFPMYLKDIIIGGNGIMSLRLVCNSPNEAEKIPPTIMNLRVLL